MYVWVSKVAHNGAGAVDDEGDAVGELCVSGWLLGAELRCA